MGTAAKRKKALIYDPYLDTLGGGERYAFTLAECLLKGGWQVDFWWPDERVIKRAADRFGLDVGKTRANSRKISDVSLREKFLVTRHYNLVFWFSDGSVPFLFGKKNLLHLQVPFKGVGAKKLLFLKKFFIKEVICNSRFTKKVVDKEYGFNGLVLYPPIDIDRFKPGIKENKILAVGRFEETMQAKRQDTLIAVFKQMVDEGLENWRLVLVGGSLVKTNPYLERLKKQAQGYPIDFIVNASFARLRQEYAQAKIFWHGAGQGVDEEKEPWRAEHFGMATVEAMAAGCVPVVVDKGGLKEIVRRGMGERWRNPQELKAKTLKLIASKSLLARLSRQAREASRKFSKDNFCRKLTVISEE